jgi:plastocyanin
MNFLVPIALTIVALQLPTGVHAGSIEGQYVLAGDIPEALKAPRVAQGNTTVRDFEVCAKVEVPNETLTVDPASRGIANIVVYLKKAPPDMPAALKINNAKPVTFDQKGCRYTPHVLAVRTGQTVNCTTQDSVAHNVHGTPFVNETFNFVVPGNAKTPSPVVLKLAETFPVPVKCDFHGWMDAYWVVTDHPYVAITDAQGKFKIDGLPEGEHNFTVWHETGYINKKLTVTVKPGAQTLPTVKVPAKQFEPKVK